MAETETTVHTRELKKEVKPRVAEQILAPDLREADYECTRYVAKVAPGVKFEDVIKPDFWAHVSERLRAWDELHVRCKDGTWMAHLVVLDASRQWARVHVLSGPHNFTNSDVSMSQAEKIAQADFDVKFRGPRKWSVVRKSDNAVLHEDESTEPGAKAWLAGHLQNQNIGMS